MSVAKQHRARRLPLRRHSLAEPHSPRTNQEKEERGRSLFKFLINKPWKRRSLSSPAIDKDSMHAESGYHGNSVPPNEEGSESSVMVVASVLQPHLHHKTVPVTTGTTVNDIINRLVSKYAITSEDEDPQSFDLMETHDRSQGSYSRVLSRTDLVEAIQHRWGRDPGYFTLTRRPSPVKHEPLFFSSPSLFSTGDNPSLFPYSVFVEEGCSQLSSQSLSDIAAASTSHTASQKYSTIANLVSPYAHGASRKLTHLENDTGSLPQLQCALSTPDDQSPPAPSSPPPSSPIIIDSPTHQYVITGSSSLNHCNGDGSHGNGDAERSSFHFPSADLGNHGNSMFDISPVGDHHGNEQGIESVQFEEETKYSGEAEMERERDGEGRGEGERGGDGDGGEDGDREGEGVGEGERGDEVGGNDGGRERERQEGEGEGEGGETRENEPTPRTQRRQRLSEIMQSSIEGGLSHIMCMVIEEGRSCRGGDKWWERGREGEGEGGGGGGGGGEGEEGGEEGEGEEGGEEERGKGEGGKEGETAAGEEAGKSLSTESKCADSELERGEREGIEDKNDKLLPAAGDHMTHTPSDLPLEPGYPGLLADEDTPGYPTGLLGEEDGGKAVTDGAGTEHLTGDVIVSGLESHSEVLEPTASELIGPQSSIVTTETTLDLPYEPITCFQSLAQETSLTIHPTLHTRVSYNLSHKSTDQSNQSTDQSNLSHTPTDQSNLPHTFTDQSNQSDQSNLPHTSTDQSNQSDQSNLPHTSTNQSNQSDQSHSETDVSFSTRCPHENLAKRENGTHTQPGSSERISQSPLLRPGEEKHHKLENLVSPVRRNKLIEEAARRVSLTRTRANTFSAGSGPAHLHNGHTHPPDGHAHPPNGHTHPPDDHTHPPSSEEGGGMELVSQTRRKKLLSQALATVKRRLSLQAMSEMTVVNSEETINGGTGSEIMDVTSSAHQLLPPHPPPGDTPSSHTPPYSAANEKSS